MKKSAYFTAKLAIKTLSSLSKANIFIHGEGNIPKGAIIFVVNHFTRIETLLLPAYVSTITSTPVWSLADASLFKGGLKKLFDLIGVISTRDPLRDQIILKSLLTGEAHWIIYPEGQMVKTKKTIDKGEFQVLYDRGGHRPHTGAALFALRAEFLREHLIKKQAGSFGEVRQFLNKLSIDSMEQMRERQTFIVPVNLTFYPIRAKANIATVLAARWMKDLPERAVEEIMTEGTMLLSGVDLDIRFGKAIGINSYIQGPEVEKELECPLAEDLTAPERLKEYFKRQSALIMSRYMEAIYNLTTINHEHLFASFLKLYPKKKIRVTDLKRRVFRAATLMADQEDIGCQMHSSLRKDQIHLLIDDRYGKYRNFLGFALEKGIVTEADGHLIKDSSKFSKLLDLHRGRIDNPVEIIANEVEPLKRLQCLVRSLAWQPDPLIRKHIVRYLLDKEESRLQEDFRLCELRSAAMPKGSAPYLFRKPIRRMGVVLVHSYLSVPEQVYQLAAHLKRNGIWVYAPRLPGHGTSPEDLSKRTYHEWLEAVETGYAIMSNICRHVVLGGMAVGGCLALELAARMKHLAGVFAVCPPYSLDNFSTMFMPTMDVWNKILSMIKKNAIEQRFIDLPVDPMTMSYPRNPVFGIMEVDRLLIDLRSKLGEMVHPALIIQASNNPVVNQRGSREVFNRLGSLDKRYHEVKSDHHIIINGEGAVRVHRLIEDFIRNL